MLRMDQAAGEPAASLSTNWLRQFAFGRWALDRRRRCLVTCPLKFNFLGHGRDGVTHLGDNGLQCISGHAEPACPGTKLSWLCQVDLVAKGRMFDALHGGFPGCGSTASEDLCSISLLLRSRPQGPREGGP